MRMTGHAPFLNDTKMERNKVRWRDAAREFPRDANFKVSPRQRSRFFLPRRRTCPFMVARSFLSSSFVFLSFFRYDRDTQLHLQAATGTQP